jgi:hypothetical protein
MLHKEITSMNKKIFCIGLTLFSFLIAQNIFATSSTGGYSGSEKSAWHQIALSGASRARDCSGNPGANRMGGL